MIRADHLLMGAAERVFAHQSTRLIKGLTSAYVAYPEAEHLEKRSIRAKLRQLRHHYQLPLDQGMVIAKERLTEILHHAGQKVFE